MIERTLVILKPCTVQRGLIGEVLSRFEKKGLKLVAMKMTMLTPEICRKHYAHKADKPYYPIIEKSMLAGPVILCCYEGVDAIEAVRHLAGPTNGREAAPGTIRGDYSMSFLENIVHASDSRESASAELERFFSPEDYCEYTSPLFDFLYGADEI